VTAKTPADVERFSPCVGAARDASQGWNLLERLDQVGEARCSLANIASGGDIAAVKTIVLSLSAAKAFDKLPPSARRQCSDALDAYAMHGAGDTRTMVGTSTVRMRSGDFRIIFDEEATRIVVLALGHRKDIYR
jgi:mRNA interferase RelE/StbE